MYCIMCGRSGHRIQECSESKFFITQGICSLDVNNRVVMSSGTALLRAEGEGGAAKQIRDCLARNMPSMPGPMAMSASNVEVVAVEVDYEDESDKLAVLGLMEFEVLPTDRLEKLKRAKPYDCPEAKKGVEKNVPENVSHSKDPQPNRAYIELPPMILKRVPPTQAPYLPVEDQEMIDDAIPVPVKGKQRELPVVAPTPHRESEVTPPKPRIHTSVLKETPKFEVANLKFSNEKMKNSAPQYKYVTELMNEMNQEQVFHNVMDQLMTLKLSKLLGTLYDLRRRLQLATHSQRFPVQQVNMVNAEILPNMTGKSQEIVNEEEGESSIESSESFEFAVNSGKANSSHASMEELHELPYQDMMQEEYIHQLTYPIKEVNLACPHEYHTMVMAHLNSCIGKQDYMMLVDSGSEVNMMMMHQAQELALPIDDLGNSWMLKGISGHMMGLEGICWNVPVKIGGIEFSHNFFIMRSDLGNKDMVLGQPWLFSHSTRIDYVHEMGVTLQLWENGDRKGRSILINLLLVKAPRNVMPIQLCCSYETFSAEYVESLETMLANPGTDLSTTEVPVFMNRVIDVLQMEENKSEKQWPDGINEALILESSLSNLFVSKS